jgi:hypothetical protein
MTPADVLKISADVRKDTALTPAQVLMGIRTLVHAQLQLEKPPPYCLPDAATGKDHESYVKRFNAAASDAERTSIHNEEKFHLAERKAAMLSAIPASAHLAFQQWKVTDLGRAHNGVTDVHHWAQMQHGKALWEEADKLVAEAGVKS